MKRRALLTLIFFLICRLAISQTDLGFFNDATRDSAYYQKTINYLYEKVNPKCKIGSSPSWTYEFGAPRSLTLLFKIQVDSSGRIMNVIPAKAEISYKNPKGKTVKKPIKGESYLTNIEGCYRKEILNLLKLNTLVVNGETVKTEVPFLVKISGI